MDTLLTRAQWRDIAARFQEERNAIMRDTFRDYAHQKFAMQVLDSAENRIYQFVEPEKA